jgi:hypothetical protein
MLKPILVRLIALCAIAVPAAAQVSTASPFGAFGEKQMDPAQMAALVASSQRTMKPASFVLSHKAELTLTADQVQQLDLLAHAEEDSLVVRQIRITAAMTRLFKKRAEGETAQSTGWVGQINEKQLRDDACEQSALQVEFMLNLLRDRQAAGTILTGTQIDRLQELEMTDMMRALKPKQP